MLDTYKEKHYGLKKSVFLDWLQLTTLPGPSLANRPPWTHEQAYEETV